MRVNYSNEESAPLQASKERMQDIKIKLIKFAVLMGLMKLELAPVFIRKQIYSPLLNILITRVHCKSSPRELLVVVLRVVTFNLSLNVMPSNITLYVRKIALANPSENSKFLLSNLLRQKLPNEMLWIPTDVRS